MNIGDPIPKGEQNEFITARNEFKAYVESNPTLQPWYEYLMTATKLQNEGDQTSLRTMGDQVANAYRELYRGPNIRLPNVQWVQDEGIRRITGHNFSLPVMVFDRNLLNVYQNLHDGTPQGISTQINGELLGLPQNTRPLSLVSLPAAEFDYAFPMPYTQRRRHELVHAVDPNINWRNGTERLIQTELVATIGEITETDFEDICRVNISPDFLFGYLRKSAPQYASAEKAKKLAEYAYSITSQRHRITGKRSNADVVRELMLTKENTELRQIIESSTSRPKITFTPIKR